MQTRVKRLILWFLLSLLPGCVPILFRLAVSNLYGRIAPLDAIDLITLGIALNIQTVHDLVTPKLIIHDFWRTFLIIIIVFVILFFGLVYTLTLLHDNKVLSESAPKALFNYTLWGTLIATTVNFMINVVIKEQKIINSP